MAGRVVGRIFERIVGSAAKKAVLLCLGEHANPDGEMSFPSVARICQETELGESTVREALAWLRKERLIIQTHGPAQHIPATYRVNLERLSDLQLVEVYRKPDLQVVGSGVQVLEPDLHQAASGVQLLESRPPGGGPEPSLTVSMNRQEPSGTAVGDRPPAAPQTLWVQILGQLQRQFRKAEFETWLRDTQVVSETDGELLVGTANSHALSWLQEHARAPAAEVAIKITERPMSVRFVILEGADVSAA